MENNQNYNSLGSPNPLECDNCKHTSFKGIYFCKFCFQNRKINPKLAEINQISKKVYLGNEEGALCKETLKELGITNILICGADLNKFHPKDFIYLHFDTLEDSPQEDIKKYFNLAIKFIESSKKVYVHCWAGVSRSASVVIAYFMWKNKLSFEKAKEFVSSKREYICPNDGFVSQLIQYEEYLIKNDFKLSKKQVNKKLIEKTKFK